nr:MAG TPA: hypothetical protein [Caudoviricetes sp.]
MLSMSMREQRLISLNQRRKKDFFGKVQTTLSNQSDILELRQIHFLLGLWKILKVGSKRGFQKLLIL